MITKSIIESMEFLKMLPFNIITEENTDYIGSINTIVRTAFPNKTYLIDALDNIHQKYPQYSTKNEALKCAKKLLLEEKTVIAVSIEEVKDHFKLHVKPSKKYEHMNTAYSRVAHGTKTSHSFTLLRKVPPVYKTTEDLIKHVGDVIGNMLSGYITISLVIGIIFGGSVLFNLIGLGAYHGYIKSFAEKYYNELIIKIKTKGIFTASEASTPSPVAAVPLSTSVTAAPGPLLVEPADEAGDLEELD